MCQTCSPIFHLLHCPCSVLILRLQRTGRSRVPTYRIVLAEKSWAAKGRFKEILGHYLRDRHPPVFQVKEERIRYWVQHGAIPSGTLARALQKSGIIGMEKFFVRYTKKAPKSVAEAPVSPPPPAGGDSVAEKG